ncbi:Asp23/Gls24 family envelope stress response protein [Pseudonocardia nantongensis]|uniref:Asp23/Gls24 family envelope stress response protein n=1 Tax=Pseudonocardia nantongensis TaxID=1181885 RepID=UPI00397AD299
MNTPEPGTSRLACGRSADQVLDQVADDRGADQDEHQKHCPHCQAALAEYGRLWAPLRTLAEEHVSAPDSIIDTALTRIRGSVEHADYGVLDSPEGHTRIAARVVVVTARECAQQTPGVRVALSKHITDRGSASGSGAGSEWAGAEVTAGVAGRSTAIEITLAADYGQNLPELAERVRRQVSDRVRELTDLEPVQITVVIDDVFD